MVHIAKTFDIKQFWDFYRSSLGIFAQIIAQQIDNHDIFGDVFFAAGKFLFIGLVSGYILPAWARAFNGFGDNGVFALGIVGKGKKQFGRAA